MDNEKPNLEAQGDKEKTQTEMEEISRQLAPLASRMILRELAVNNNLSYLWTQGHLDLTSGEKKENGETLFFNIKRNGLWPEKTTIHFSWHQGRERIDLFWNLILRKEFVKGNYSMSEPLDRISVQINVKGGENSPWPLPKSDDFSRENYRNCIPTDDAPFYIRVNFAEHKTLQCAGTLPTPTNSIPYANDFGLETMKWALQVSEGIFNQICSIFERRTNTSTEDLVRNFIQKNKTFIQENNPFLPPRELDIS